MKMQIRKDGEVYREKVCTGSGESFYLELPWDAKGTFEVQLFAVQTGTDNDRLYPISNKAVFTCPQS